MIRSLLKSFDHRSSIIDHGWKARHQQLVRHESGRPAARNHRSKPDGRAVAESTNQSSGGGSQHELQCAEQRGSAPGGATVWRHGERRRVRHHEAVTGDEAEQRHKDAREPAESCRRSVRGGC